MMGYTKTGGLETRTGNLGFTARDLPPRAMGLCVQRQAAVVCVLLCFFRFSILALQISKRHVE